MHHLAFVILSIALFLTAGCATAPQPVYVTEAQQVTTQALEPVNLDSIGLEEDLQGKFRQQLSTALLTPLMNDIQAQLANTRRFTKVLLNASDQETYIVEPRIENLTSYEAPLNMDPSRKLAVFKTDVRLDVKFMNNKGQVELVKSFMDNRKLEIKLPKNDQLSFERKQEQYKRVVSIAFRAAADRLGSGFNPSYEIGIISRINGKVAYVQINTSRLQKIPKKQQSVEVVDDNNQVLASIDELLIEDGSLSGKLYEKSNITIREGQKVRARVNAMLLD